MQLQLNAPLLALAAGQVVTLDDAQGTRILARSGTVWVTEEGENLDHIVGPGDALIVARSGRTVVQALESSWISLADGPVAANQEYDFTDRMDAAPRGHAAELSASDACDEARARVDLRVPYY